MKNKPGDKSKALRDEGMSSATDLRNSTTPRKAKDMPEDKGRHERDPEKDYEGPARKDH